MIALDEIRDWLKTADQKFDHYYIGKLDSKQLRSLGVYRLNDKRRFPIDLGGLDLTPYNEQRVSLLIHYNKNQKETEAASMRLFEWLLLHDKAMIGNTEADFIGMLVPEPQLIGTDESGVYEAVIEMEIYSRRQ